MKSTNLSNGQRSADDPLHEIEKDIIDLVKAHGPVRGVIVKSLYKELRPRESGNVSKIYGRLKYLVFRGLIKKAGESYYVGEIKSGMRYFWLNYGIQFKNGWGEGSVPCSGEGFMNLDRITSQIIEKNQKKSGPEIDNIVIRSWQELSAEDYEEFIK